MPWWGWLLIGLAGGGIVICLLFIWVISRIFNPRSWGW